MPASIANLSLEESQKLNVDTLKKLKGRDKRIAELTALNEKLAAWQQSEGGSSSTASLQVANQVCALQISLKPLSSALGDGFLLLAGLPAFKKCMLSKKIE